MPPILRWWLNRQWAQEAYADVLARLDVTIIALGVFIAALAF